MEALAPRKAGPLYQVALSFAAGKAVFRSPRLAASLLGATLQRVGSPEAKHTVLVMQRAGLHEDAFAMAEGRAEVALLLAPQGIMKAIARGFLPPAVDDNNYVGHPPDIEEKKTAYREFLREMLRHLRRRHPIDAIVSGNFCYFAERELQSAAEAEGLPFVVIHKESLKSPGRRDFFQELYRARRGRFGGRRILLYNDLERQAQIKAGVVEPDRAVVCGMPRLDRAHLWRQAQAGTRLQPRPVVLYFTFSSKDGLPRIHRKEKGKYFEPLPPGLQELTWNDTARLTAATLVSFAVENPEVLVLVKAKRRAEHKQVIDEVLSRYENPPPNVEFVWGGEPFELLQRAWVVVGMNSTAILEALAMGKAVLTPGFGEAALPERQPWIADLGEDVRVSRDVSEMARDLRAICSGEPPLVDRSLSPGRVEALMKWVGNVDGLAGERVWAYVRAEIEAKCPPPGDAKRLAAPLAAQSDSAPA